MENEEWSILIPKKMMKDFNPLPVIRHKAEFCRYKGISTEHDGRTQISAYQGKCCMCYKEFPDHIKLQWKLLHG